MLLERLTGRAGKFGKLTKEDTKFAGLPATPDFTSAEQTVTVDTLLDVAHSLGAVPTLWQIVLRCTTNDQNFLAGDEVIMNVSGATADLGITFSVDATNMTVVQGAAITVHNQSTFNLANITTSSWRWVMRAWK